MDELGSGSSPRRRRAEPVTGGRMICGFVLEVKRQALDPGQAFPTDSSLCPEPAEIDTAQLISRKLKSGFGPLHKSSEFEKILTSLAWPVRLCTGGLVIRTEAWPFYRTSSDVRLCWELEEPQGPKGPKHIFGEHSWEPD